MCKILVRIFLLTFISYSQALPAEDFRWDSFWDGRIVGGESVSETEPLPYQVSLQSSNRHYCGGSIINKRFVITAAHCVNRSVSSSDTVAWGGVYKSSLPYRASVVKFTCHEGYNRNNLDYDFALVEVDKDLYDETGNATVGPIPFCNAACNNQISGTALSTSGWGALSEGGAAPEQLQTVSIPSVDQTQCNEYYKPTGYAILDSMICAGFPEGGKDACQGDSGGPLVARENGQTCLVGCTSWGDGCAREERPGVWSCPCKYSDWVAANAGGVQVVS